MMDFLFLGAIVVALLGHGYFWVAIVNRLHGVAGARKLIDGATLLCLVCFLALPVYVLLHGKAVHAYWHSLSVPTASFAVRYFQACLLMSVGEVIAKVFYSPRCNDPATLLQAGAEAVEVASDSGSNFYRGSYPQFLAAIPGNQSTELQIDRKRIAIPRLHKAHDGLRIAHLSDFHMTGRLEKDWYQQVVDQVNLLGPDVIAITGDIIENPDCFLWLEETIALLQAKLGVYFIMGNHDRYVDVARTKTILARAGQICVSGQCLEATWNGAPVLLAGNERPWLSEVGEFPPAKERDENQLPLRIALQHTPDQWNWSLESDVDLVLAGHTHGGQLCFPLLGAVACPSLYGTRYAKGVFRQGNSVMHVTRGLSGRTPLRWLCRPEIALLELVGTASTA